jgi:hypothetical protein
MLFLSKETSYFYTILPTDLFTGTVSTMSSRAMILWAVVMLTAFCCPAEAAPEAFIAPNDLRDLQLGLTENGLQVSHV